MQPSEVVHSHTQRSHERRGTAALLVVVCSAMLIGFASLAVDVGHMYNVRAELQRTADAAALAAAAELGDFSDGDPLWAARATAQEYARRNPVLGDGIELDPTTDIVFGRAEIDRNTGRYTFEPTESFPNAVRVRARRTSDSANGAVPLFFANIFGFAHTDIVAEAAAVLIPRDIVLVADLSASHTDDSELQHCGLTNINLYDAWAALPGGLASDEPGYDAQFAGPRFGRMDRFGDLTIDCPPLGSYNPSNDDGLQYLPYNTNWTDGDLSASLLGQGYSNNEVSAIMNRAYDSSGAWQARVATALGLAIWRSGMPDGLWEALGLAPGDGNDAISWDSELTFVEAWPYAGGSWKAYIDYVKSSSTAMVRNGHIAFQYRFGPKTFTNYLLEQNPEHAKTPELANVPEQPMQAVKDAATHLTTVVEELKGSDLLGLVGYGLYGYGPAEHPDELSWLTTGFADVRGKIAGLQAGYWTIYTNIAQGIDVGADVLIDSPEARPAAAKIMILLTDGNANRTRSEVPQSNTAEARSDASEAARDARREGIRIYTVSVGANADTALMEEIAQIGNGDSFHAHGSIQAIEAQLADIFEDLGGTRPVALIQ